MAWQHAHETVAQVARVYGAVRDGRLRARSPGARHKVLRLCGEVVGRLERACKGRIDVRGFADVLGTEARESLGGLLPPAGSQGGAE